MYTKKWQKNKRCCPAPTTTSCQEIHKHAEKKFLPLGTWPSQATRHLWKTTKEQPEMLLSNTCVILVWLESPWDLVKMRIQAEQIWGGTWPSTFLTNAQVMVDLASSYTPTLYYDLPLAKGTSHFISWNFIFYIWKSLIHKTNRLLMFLVALTLQSSVAFFFLFQHIYSCKDSCLYSLISEEADEMVYHLASELMAPLLP